jgi:hypothetical protein
MTREVYTIRNAQGTLLMRIVGKSVQNMFTKLKGDWRTYQEEGMKRTVCYELSQDSVWESETPHGAFRMYLWKGTKIIKE